MIGSALSEPGLAIVAALLAVLLFAGAAIAFVRRSPDAACETDLAPAASSERTREAAKPSGGEPRT